MFQRYSTAGGLIAWVHRLCEEFNTLELCLPDASPGKPAFSCTLLLHPSLLLAPAGHSTRSCLIQSCSYFSKDKMWFFFTSLYRWTGNLAEPDHTAVSTCLRPHICRLRVLVSVSEDFSVWCKDFWVISASILQCLFGTSNLELFQSATEQMLLYVTFPLQSCTSEAAC